MSKIALLILSLNIVGCGYNWPIDPPIVYQCQFNWTKEHPQGGWFCISTHEDKKDRKREFREVFDPRMKGAQGLSREDYLKSEEWADELKKWAIDNCKL